VGTLLVWGLAPGTDLVPSANQGAAERAGLGWVVGVLQIGAELHDPLQDEHRVTDSRTASLAFHIVDTSSRGVAAAQKTRLAFLWPLRPVALRPWREDGGTDRGADLWPRCPTVLFCIRRRHSSSLTT
jgi:hypothetical protein